MRYDDSAATILVWQALFLLILSFELDFGVNRSIWHIWSEFLVYHSGYYWRTTMMIWTVFLCLVFWPQASQADSSLRVENGVYSRVTVQIEEQPQPENCVEYLNHLEVRKTWILRTFLSCSEKPQFFRTCESDRNFATGTSDCHQDFLEDVSQYKQLRTIFPVPLALRL